MSIRHPEFCELVEKLYVPSAAPLRERLNDDDIDLLREYARGRHCFQGDQLGADTREAVEELTGRDDVWSPGRASHALLASMGEAR